MSSMCWECYNCVKICPTQAVEVRGYADFVPLGATVTPLRSTDSIMWTVKFRNGMVKRFKFPIRTTAEGKAVPDGGFATAGGLEQPRAVHGTGIDRAAGSVHPQEVGHGEAADGEL